MPINNNAIRNNIYVQEKIKFENYIGEELGSGSDNDK